jgi:large subunit ribosomal protein L18
MAVNKAKRRQKIRYKIRKKINGSAEKPRLSVFRSNKQIYAQIIDDVAGVTLASASSRQGASGANKVEIAKAVGMSLAEKAKSKGVSAVVFDRGGYLFHGRVKALAEGAREGGLQF